MPSLFIERVPSLITYTINPFYLAWLLATITGIDLDCFRFSVENNEYSF